MRRIFYGGLLFSLVFGSMFLRCEARADTSLHGLAALGAYLGTWKGGGQMKDTPYSKAASPSAETICQWSQFKGFLVCNQRVEMGGATHEDLSLYTYREKDQAYLFVGLSQNEGGPRQTKLEIERNVWTYSSDFEDGGKRIRVRTINRFTSASRVTFQTEYSEDGVNWVLMGEGASTKVR